MTPDISITYTTIKKGGVNVDNGTIKPDVKLQVFECSRRGETDAK